jgi:UDP-N-acetylglucosamine 4-epimerase
MIQNFYPEIPNFSSIRFLVTGGAGFIGSHVLDFLAASRAKSIRVFDNLSTGNKQNIQHLLPNQVEFIEGDICDPAQCEKACEGIDIVIHLAALGSVPRSIVHPLATHAANSTGFLNMLWAAKTKGVKKVIYASSSSVYGDNLELPKKEGKEGNPLSPYAFTKQSNEAYAKLFSELYGLETIGLRFFNVFGPRQNKDGPYAAFIPLVLSALASDHPLTLFGNGEQSRDFTFVANSVWAISGAIRAEKSASGKAYNIACGASSSLLEVVKTAEELTGKKIKLQFEPPRKGDIKDSLADISLAAKHLGFASLCDLKAGLAETIAGNKYQVTGIK